LIIENLSLFLSYKTIISDDLILSPKLSDDLIVKFTLFLKIIKFECSVPSITNHPNLKIISFILNNHYNSEIISGNSDFPVLFKHNDHSCIVLRNLCKSKIPYLNQQNLLLLTFK
jgi:hypothetical protein